MSESGKSLGDHWSFLEEELEKFQKIVAELEAVGMKHRYIDRVPSFHQLKTIFSQLMKIRQNSSNNSTGDHYSSLLSRPKKCYFNSPLELF